MDAVTAPAASTVDAAAGAPPQCGPDNDGSSPASPSHAANDISTL